MPKRKKVVFTQQDYDDLAKKSKARQKKSQDIASKITDDRVLRYLEDRKKKPKALIETPTEALIKKLLDAGMDEITATDLVEDFNIPVRTAGMALKRMEQKGMVESFFGYRLSRTNGTMHNFHIYCKVGEAKKLQKSVNKQKALDIHG